MIDLNFESCMGRTPPAADNYEQRQQSHDAPTDKSRFGLGHKETEQPIQDESDEEEEKDCHQDDDAPKDESMHEWDKREI